MTDTEDYLDRLRLRGGLDKMGRALPNSATGGSRWRHYLRCDECGVDPGKACRDDDDREALVVCDGRVLRVPKGPLIQSHRGLGRTPERMAELASRRATIDQRPQAKSRRARGILATPVMAPCICCGTQTRLWGAAHITGRTWCSAAECQRDRTRERDAKSNARRRIREAATPKAPHKTRPCVICGDPVRAHGVTSANEPACPGACRTERWRRRVDAQNARDRAARAGVEVDPLSCAWCSSPVPRAGRDPRERACCGATACLEARRIGYRPRPVSCHWCGAPVANTGRDLSDRACCGEIGCVRMRIRTERAETRHRKAVLEKHQPNA